MLSKGKPAVLVTIVLVFAVASIVRPMCAIVGTIPISPRSLNSNSNTNMRQPHMMFKNDAGIPMECMQLILNGFTKFDNKY